MNHKERLLATLAGIPGDRPPFICPGGMMTMVVSEVMDQCHSFWPEAHSDPELMAGLTLAAHELAGIENVGVPFCMTVEAEGMGAQVGLGSKESEPRVERYILERFDQLERLTPLDPQSGRAAVCLEAIRILKRRAPELPVIANLSGPVSLATSLIDPLLYYRALRRDPEAAHRLTRHCTQELQRFGEVLIEAGADLICIADPSATGDIIGRGAFLEIALPYLNQLTDHFKERFGVPTIVHICGNVKALGDGLSQLSAHALSIDSLVGIDVLRELAPGRPTMGNISTILLEQGTPEQLARASRRCLEQGVDILAPACGIGPRTPLANIRAVAESVATPQDRA
ncbi:methylcobamide--CoM methyltransferase [Geomonas silvestris]|uniref:Methylcobamide--CoM methyltransferase n=1 Tax=Geomonas silvestris TaxID=2740184 RepID=A0A6V8ML69_9BACT|nr:uroporphyrinogen decarboxylase family protein [Geomonas silvestris]GFO60617.1 methylcobamide--CoM methyltransferase [Geomonas silvestris]